jgi:hypothetical protein
LGKPAASLASRKEIVCAASSRCIANYFSKVNEGIIFFQEKWINTLSVAPIGTPIAAILAAGLQAYSQEIDFVNILILQIQLPDYFCSLIF